MKGCRRPGRSRSCRSSPCRWSPRSRSSGRLRHATRASSSMSAMRSCRSPGTGSTGPARASSCGRSASTRRRPTRSGVDVYRLRYRYVVARRSAGRARRGDDHARHPARLVRRPDGQRQRLDRDRPRDLRPVGSAQGRDRRLPVRCDLTPPVRPPGPDRVLRHPEPDLREPLADVLPPDGPLRSWSSSSSSSARARPPASGSVRRRPWAGRSSGVSAAPDGRAAP